MRKKSPRAQPRRAVSSVTAQNTRSERNRERLLDAAMRLLLAEGMSKFTSSHIAHAAGLHKPAFYAHFKNTDECLQAVALHVTAANVEEMYVAQTVPLGPTSDPIERNQRSLERLLGVVQQHQILYKLLRRYQTDESPLGAAIRKIDDYVYERWVEYFWRLAVQFGIDAKHFKEVAQMAEHIVGMTYIAIARVLDGRVTDIGAEALRVARYHHAVLTAEFTRMLGQAPS